MSSGLKTSSLKTPLKRVRGLGSARSGTSHFWMQRVSAIANIPLTLGFLVIVLSLVGGAHADAVAALHNPLTALLLLLFVLSGVWHMRLGMQVLLEDYLPHEGVRLAALIANILFAACVGVACIYAILKVGFSA